MKAITLPHSQLTVSQLAFGCWGITTDFHWGSRDEQESIATIQSALDLGITFFDTAELYGEGNSERLLGKALGKHRNEVVIASKMSPAKMKETELIQACEDSLNRLGTDYLDLYQTHWTNRDVPLDESWGALIKLKEQGKVREIGVCNMGVQDIEEVCRLQVPVSNQLPYNLIWRTIEHDILPDCRKRNIGVLVYSPLMHGMLAGKYKTASDVPDGRARSRHFNSDREMTRHGESGCEEETFAAIHSIQQLAESLNRSMADLSLGWLLAQSGISSIIAGAKTPEQLTGNVKSFEQPLSADVVEELNRITEPVNLALGSNPDMWDGGNNSRYR